MRQLFFFLLLSVATILQPLKASSLQLCMQDIIQPPWSIPGRGGLNYLLLERVAELTGESFELVPKPWRRCLSDLNAGRVDGVVGVAYSPSRGTYARFPVLRTGQPNPDAALYTARATVFLRVGGNAIWDGTTLTNPRRTVIAQRDYLVGDILREQGFLVLDDAKSAEDGLRLLQNDGADVAILHGEYAIYQAHTHPRLQGRILVSPQPFTLLHKHLAFSRVAYRKNPERFEAIWAAITKIRRSSDYRVQEAAAIQQILKEGNMGKLCESAAC